MKNIDDKKYEILFLVIALSSLTVLALITGFIFYKGLPIIAKVGLFDFIFGMKWAPYFFIRIYLLYNPQFFFP